MKTITSKNQDITYPALISFNKVTEFKIIGLESRKELLNKI